ncbi:unnamed protein product [Cyclocybe aegerita]|uniref:Uncharacterized protein n=1 Tax=Cyclocybe aegerita TaxID=1973307 RepID=A0A8S0XZJ2_CYCAE|nr:unnamed protein product [Cyclocybe aegerita]
MALPARGHTQSRFPPTALLPAHHTGQSRILLCIGSSVVQVPLWLRNTPRIYSWMGYMHVINDGKLESACILRVHEIKKQYHPTSVRTIICDQFRANVSTELAGRSEGILSRRRQRVACLVGQPYLRSSGGRHSMPRYLSQLAYQKLRSPRIFNAYIHFVHFGALPT